MSTDYSEPGPSFGNYILTNRKLIGWLLVAVTVFMGYWAVHVPIATRFEDLFPSGHPNTMLYRKHRAQYGRALTVALLLRVDHGDIFNFKTLKTIQDINHDVDILPGVNHNEVFSLASFRVFYSTASPGTLTISPFMFPKIPANATELEALKANVRAHQLQLAGVVTSDLKGGLIIAGFNEDGLDYKVLFDSVQRILSKYQDSNTRIYASGPVMFYGWGYHYLPLLEKIFAASFGLVMLLTFLTLGGRSGWWAPIVTGVGSAVWGLGFMGFRGYNFDPVMLVVPLILTTRNLAHGMQWQGRYYRELDKANEKIVACVATTNAMLKPGLLAVLANIAGIVFVALSDVPVLKQIGIGGAVWLGASLILVFVGQPILMSYLPRPRARVAQVGGGALGDSLAAITSSGGLVRAFLIVGGLGAIALGLFSYQHVLIGFQTAGTPLYRADAKVNRDTAEISRYIPTNTAWVVLDSPDYSMAHPNPQSGYGTKTLRMADDMAAYLLSRGDVAAVIGLVGVIEKPMNQLFHNSAPKYFAIPDTEQLSTELFFFFVQSATPDEVTAYFENLMSARNSCIRLLLPDHTSARLSRLRADLDTFVRERVLADPELKDIAVHYLGGDVGLYQASDDVMKQINRRSLLLVLTAILILATITFRSTMAGALLVFVALSANLVAYTYMNREVIGLTVDTVSVISISVGLGVSYAIYALAAIRDELVGGLLLNQAIPTALRGTGVTILSTYVVMIAALAPWVFSPVLFQSEMSALLIVLMTTNLIAGLLILPALLVLIRPRFLVRYESVTLAEIPGRASVN
jgi:predicted RND superfamily exporter protein